MNETAERFRAVRMLIRERLAAMSPAERDQLIQVYIAQGMTIEQRWRATSSLVRFALACSRRRSDPS